jgi:DNA-binding beta-propeller fold protein YncE
MDTPMTRLRIAALPSAIAPRKGGTAVDLAEAKAVGTVPLSGKPEASAADGRGHMFVNVEDKNLITKFDSRSLAVEGNWPTAPCEAPGPMAIDPKNHRLFVGCHGKSPVMLVMDTDSGKIVTSLPIGSGTDAAAFDPKTRMVFSSNGEGTLTVIQQESADKYTVADTVKTEPGARTMALDLKTHKIYLITADRKPAPPAAEGERAPRPEVVPGTFRVLVVGR